MAKESKSPAGETILEQQKRGVNTVSSMAQVGVGLAAFAVALTGFPVYLAAPIASGVGVAGNIATNYLVSNSIGRGKEKGIIARLAGAAALQSDRLATYLPRTQYREDKKDPEKAEALSKLQDKGGTGLFYVGGALTLASVAADVAKSFFPIPTPPITTTLLPIALAGMMACDSFAAGSKEALKDTIVGDAQEALGAIAKRTNQISRQAVQNHIATSIANVPVIGKLVQGMSIISAVKSITGDAYAIWALTMSGRKNAAEAKEIAERSSSFDQANSSVTMFAKVAIVVGIALLIISTGGVAGGVAGLAILTPALIGVIACGIGVMAGVINYYYHGSKTLDQIIEQDEKLQANKDRGKGKEKGIETTSPTASKNTLEETAKQAAQGLRDVNHDPHKTTSRETTTVEQAAQGLRDVNIAPNNSAETTTVEQAAQGLKTVNLAQNKTTSRKRTRITSGSESRSKTKSVS
jgi:hypothetical protein